MIWPRISNFQASSECGRLARLQMLDRGGPLVAQMDEQDVAEFAAGAAAQRIQDGLVLAHGFAPSLPLAGEIGGVAHPPDPSGEIGVGAEQRRVARGFDDLLVDQLVDPKIAVHVAMQVEAVHLVMQPLDLGDLGIGDVFAGEPAGQAFEPAHDVEQFGEILLAQLPHPGAAVRQQFDQSFRRQHLQGLAQRRARDAQHLAKLALGNAAAVGNVALDDVVAQPGQDLVMQRQVFPDGFRAGADGRRGVFTGNHRFMAGT